MIFRKILPVVALLVLWSSCKKADPVVGKWVEAEGDGWAEYFADGDVILNDGAKSASGTWKRLDDGRVKVDTLVKGNSTVEVYQVAIEDGAATFTSSAGRVRKYQRSGAAAATAGKDDWSEVNSRLARDREAQRKTVADVRMAGTAMFSWLTDQVGAAAAGQSQHEKGRWTDLRSYTPI